MYTVYCIVYNVYMRREQDTGEHRRTINTEEKAKVFAAAWVPEFINILAAQAILH